MINDRLVTGNGVITSLQISVLNDIPTDVESFNPGKLFLIKNNTAESIVVTIIPASQELPVETIVDPGWNPEICKAILNPPADLQYGY